jgi:DNA-binding response OmpR family regulator
MVMPNAQLSAGLGKSERHMYPEGEEILIVDHDDARRSAIDTILRHEGFAITVVTEGLAALRAVAQREFALVIAAMRLPGTLDGIVTMRQARMKRPGLKFLLIADYPHAPLWLNRDSDDVIAAPFHRWELLGCVFELMQRASASDTADLGRRARAAL